MFQWKLKYFFTGICFLFKKTSDSHLFCFQLPEPLLTFKLYPELVKLTKDESADKNAEEATTVQKLKALIDQLPKANHRTCAMLMHHLKRVSQQEEYNQMTAGNLGIVFGPTLLRPRYLRRLITFRYCWVTALWWHH